MSSVFTKIISGGIHSYKLYEDEYCFAILDIHPVKEGHVLVLSKREVARYEDLTEDEYAGVMRGVHKLANKIQEVYECERVFQMAHSYGVPHVHIHLIPTDKHPEVTKAVLDHEAMDMDAPIDHESLKRVAQELTL